MCGVAVCVCVCVCVECVCVGGVCVWVGGLFDVMKLIFFKAVQYSLKYVLSQYCTSDVCGE